MLGRPDVLPEKMVLRNPSDVKRIIPRYVVLQRI